MATIRIDIQSQGNARQELQQVQRQVVALNERIAQNNRLAVDATGNARQSLQQQNQRLRAERGLLTAQRQRLNLLLPGLRDEIRATREATQATRRFSGVLNEIGGIVGGIGIAELAFHIQQFATNSVRAAAELQGFERGLQIIEGTNAPNRLQELIEVANLPGLQLAQLINYNNRLRAIGLSAEEVDSILLTTGQTILAMGGTSDIASQAVEQLVQALQTNTVSLQDFRSIAQRIPGFYQAIAATHDVEASIDGFRVAVDNAGGSVKDALLPVMDELARRFGSPPADSYVVAIDGLQNSFFLLQAEIGNNLLPILAQAATGLSQFFDAIREGNLDELPAPIQAIVSGAQNLYNGLIQVGEAIRRGLGPELDLLLPALGTLLGNVLDLAGSLATALSPAFELLAVPTRVAISLIAHLAETLSNVIGGITDFVNWVTGAAESQEQLRTSTQQTAQVMMTTATATQQAADSTQNLQGNLQTLQSTVSETRQRLDEKRQALQNLIERGVNEAHPAVEQLNRQISALEAQLPMATAQVDALKQGFLTVEMPASSAETATRGFVSSIDDFGGALERVDTRFLTFHERADTLSGSIRALPSEITAVRTEFDVLAPTAERVNAIFTTYNETLGEYVRVSGIVVTSAQAEQEALDAVTQGIVQQTQDAEGLAHVQEVLTQRTDAHNAALVNPAVSDAADSLRNYANIIGDVNLGYDEIIPITQDFVDGLGRQESAFDDLRTAADAAEISLDDIDDTFSRIPDAIDPSIVSMEDFETVALRALRDIGDELSAFEGGLGDVGIAVDNLVTLFANPINFAAGTLGAVIEGLTTLEDFAGPLGLPEGFFDDPAPGQAQVNPRNIRSAQDQEAQQTHLAGIARYLDTPGGGEFLRANAPELLQRPGTREFVEQNYPELVDILYPRGQGFNQSGALAGRRRAQSIAERTGTDRQAIEDVAREQYGAADYAAEVAAATGEALQGSVQPPDIAEIEADQPQSTERETRDQARAAEQMRRDEERRQRDAQREAQREADNQARLAEQMRRDEERRQRDAQREADNQARAEERARAEAARAAEREAEQVARAEQDRLRTAERERQEAARAAERAEAERIRAAERVADAQEREEQDRLRVAEREAEQVARAEQDRLRAAERAEAEQRRIAERAERDRLRAAERTQQIAEQEERDRLRAAEREERERTQLIEREQRERQQLAERQQREEERANQERLREEMRTQDRIGDLRDDAVDNEQDRLMRLEDINEDHQQRLEDIERDGLRRRQELQREFGRDTQDLFQEAREQIANILIDEGVGAGDINRFLSGIEGNVPSQISESGLSQIRQLQRQRLESQLELQRQRDRALEDLGFREGQQREDAGLRQAQSAQEVNERARAETLRIERETAALQSTTAMTEATTAQTTSETAVTESANATMMSESIGVFSGGSDTLNTAGDRLLEAGDHIIDGISGSGLMDAASALQAVAENFHVLVTGNTADVRQLAVAGSAPPVLPPTVTQPAPTTPQGNQMAIINMEFPDGTIKELRGQIVQQQQDGRGL